MNLSDFIAGREWKVRSIDRSNELNYFITWFVPCELALDECYNLLIKVNDRVVPKVLVLNFSSIINYQEGRYLEGAMNDYICYSERRSDGKYEMIVFQHIYGHFQIEEI